MIKIEGEAAMMLEPVVVKVQKLYKLPRYRAVAYCIKAMMLCSDSGDFDLAVDRLYIEGGNMDAVAKSFPLGH